MVQRDGGGSSRGQSRPAAHQQQIAAIIQADTNIAGFMSAIGGSTQISGPNIGRLFIGLKPRDQRASTALEVIARLSGYDTSTPLEIVRRSFRKVSGRDGAEFEAAWRRFLHDGMLEGSAVPMVQPALRADLIAEAARMRMDMTYRPPDHLERLVASLYAAPPALIETVKKLVPNMQ